MICLNSAICNETTGLCVDCPAGFTNDEVFFQGNVNCGLNIRGLEAIYIITSAFAIFVFVVSFFAALRKKKSLMKKILFLTSAWNLFIPPSMLAHYLEGYKFGAAAIVLTFIVLFSVNTITIIIMYHLATFSALIDNKQTGSRVKIYLFYKYWHRFWMFNKLVFLVVILVGLIIQNIDIINAGILATIFSLFVEVSLNIFIILRGNIRFVRAIKKLQNELDGSVTVTHKMDTLVDLAKKFQQARILLFAYGIIFFLIGAGLVTLYIVFDSSVPYAVVFFGLTFISWPMVGLIAVALLRSNYAKQILERVEEAQKIDSPSFRLFRVLTKKGDKISLGTNQLTTIDS